MNREPVVSGRFYPDDPGDLREMMASCFASPLGIGKKTIPVAGKLRALVLPHAGYIFSGPVVTWGMARLREETPVPRRFLLMGPKHTPFGAQAAVSSVQGWRTPLGIVPIDGHLREALVSSGCFHADNAAHAQEHSLEVMLPFLQQVAGSQPFSIAALALGYADFAVIREWGSALARVLQDPRFADVCVIISSDFSHETPRAEAYRIDSQALDVIERGNAEDFYRLVIDEDRSICGVIPISTWLSASAGQSLKISRLTYSTSMDVMDHPRGVGYAAIAFEEPMAPGGA